MVFIDFAGAMLAVKQVFFVFAGATVQKFFFVFAGATLAVKQVFFVFVGATLAHFCSLATRCFGCFDAGVALAPSVGFASLASLRKR